MGQDRPPMKIHKKGLKAATFSATALSPAAAGPLSTVMLAFLRLVGDADSLPRHLILS